MDDERENSNFIMFWTDASFRQWEMSVFISLVPLLYWKIVAIIVYEVGMLGYVISRGMTLSELNDIGELNLMKDEHYE